MGSRFTLNSYSYHGKPGIASAIRFAVLLCVAPLSVLNAASLNLTWSDNSENEDGFEIERSESSGEFSVLASVTADENNFRDSSVVPGVEYQYRVRAYNAFGYSGYTNVSQGSVENTPPTLGEVGDVVFPAGDLNAEILIPVFDVETSIENLAFEVISSNLSVLPLEGIETVVQDGILKLQFATAGELGSSNLTLLVSDGSDIAQTTFNFELGVNTKPTISSTQRIKVSNLQEVGPITVSVNDAESEGTALVVSAESLDESIVPAESIRVLGSGNSREIYFDTLDVASGQGTIRLTVSDGVNVSYGAIPFEMFSNEAPTIAGLNTSFTLSNGARLTGLSFEIADEDSDLGSLTVSAWSSNTALISSGGLKVFGTGSSRQLSVSPTVLYSGATKITVSVSDGYRTTEKSFDLDVLPPDEIVEIVDFNVEEGLAAIEVTNRGVAVFSLWKIDSPKGAWERVKDAMISKGPETTLIVDPDPITDSVCYRVIASQ